MSIEHIPVIVVSYNSPDLIDILLGSLRRHYGNKVYVIDGSSDAFIEPIRAVTAKYPNVEFIPFGYNIHHGPGMAWAIHHLPLAGKVLFLDSDVEVINGGFIESLDSMLEPHLYGVGGVHPVDELGNDWPDDTRVHVPYLHPAIMLCNLDVMKQWPMPIKHGAPMVQTMLTLFRAGKSDLLRHAPWVRNDNTKGSEKVFLKHDWQGTVLRTRGYHYDAPTVGAPHNPDLLNLIAPNAQKLIEVGCNTGNLARAFRTINPICNYTGIEIDDGYVGAARAHCDMVLNMNIETASDAFFAGARDCDHWIFGDVLEHLTYPWQVLERIRQVIPAHGAVVACVPNLQHWSIQARISIGNFNYDPVGGLLDRTHLRWFTRKTLIEMFHNAGFAIESLQPRVFQEPQAAGFLPLIRAMAQHGGGDPDEAVRDALALQYVVRAVPA